MLDDNKRLMQGRLDTYDKKESNTQYNLMGLAHQKIRLNAHGGELQQERMIKDKRRSLDRAVWNSYQAAETKLIDSDIIARALINPDKLKQDYDDKIPSIGFEYGYKPGDVFEWVKTNTYWLIYLQELSEIAYFRGSIRRCDYQIKWKDEDGYHSTYAAIRGPVETKINYIQKHEISVDTPNHSLNILMPKNDETLKYFRRYSKFYLSGLEPNDENICWRVEAKDSISMPGILEVVAVEYYSNKDEDNIEEGIIGDLIAEPVNPNDNEIEEKIVGDTFIKPNQVYEYKFTGEEDSNWEIDTKKYPVKWSINPNNKKHIKLVWTPSMSGQFTIKYGDYEKTIVVESLF